jgi:hypothetical protein
MLEKAKRRIAVLVIFALAMTMNTSVFAAPIPPAEVKIIDEITFAMPYAQDLLITATNIPEVCLDWYWSESLHQVKLYFTPETTLSFNKDIGLSFYADDTQYAIQPTANTVIQVARFQSLNSFLTKDGNIRYSDNLIKENDLLMFSIDNIYYYEQNLADGSTFINLNDWKVETDSGSKYDPLPILYDELKNVKDDASAIAAVTNSVNNFSNENKADVDLRDDLIRYTENAMLRARMATSDSGDLNLTSTSFSDYSAQIQELKASMEEVLANAGIERNREIETYYGISFSANPVTINIDASFGEGSVDRVVALVGDVSLNIKKSEIHESFSVTVEAEADYTGNDQNGNSLDTTLYAALPSEGANITFSSNPTSSSIDLGLVSINKVADKNQTIRNTTTNENIGGVYNPNTNKQDAAIRSSGTYKTEKSQYNFTDISNLSSQIQDAILFLRNKGRVNGTSESEFSPDEKITRAQFAQMLLYALSENSEAYSNGGFSDVPQSEWYAYSAGASKHLGYVSGYEDNTFRPAVTIPKEQLVSISGRALGKRHYYITSSPETILSGFADLGAISSWAQKDIALMAQQGCIKYLSDAKFNPADSISRAQAAEIIYNIYQKAY